VLTGLRAGRAPEVAGRMGALAASYVIEQQGPQTHSYTREGFAARYAAEFGDSLD
jgi:adenosine kinase